MAEHPANWLRFTDYTFQSAVMQGVGKLLVIAGVVLVVVGVLFWLSPRIPFIGKLPGDIYIKRENFTFYFPLATSILLSVLLSLILYVIRKFS